MKALADSQNVRYYRPAPVELEGNEIYALMLEHLEDEGYKPLSFSFWRFGALWSNRKRCCIIHTHWPEGIWRSEHAPICYILAFRFLLVYTFSRLLGYRWVWSAHNVIPHYQVRAPLLERIMRLFMLRYFDLIIGLSDNTQADLKLAFGSCGRSYIKALHGTYDDVYPVYRSRRDVRRELDIPDNATVFLVMNGTQRNNRGISEFITTWERIENKDLLYLVVTGEGLDGLESISSDRLKFIAGRVDRKDLGSLFCAVDFLVLNYSSITTSGMFYLALTFDLPVIAPRIPFFLCHGDERVTLFIEPDEPLENQVIALIEKIRNGWRADPTVFRSIKERHSHTEAARKIATAFRSLEM